MKFPLGGSRSQGFQKYFILLPYRTPSPRPHLDPIQHPKTRPKPPETDRNGSNWTFFKLSGVGRGGFVGMGERGSFFRALFPSTWRIWDTCNTQNLPHFRAFPASIRELSPPKCLLFMGAALAVPLAHVTKLVWPRDHVMEAPCFCSPHAPARESCQDAHESEVKLVESKLQFRFSPSPISQGQIFAVWILAAKLPNSDLNFDVDFGVGFFLLFLSRKKALKTHPKNPQNSPRTLFGKIPVGFLQKPPLDNLSLKSFSSKGR